MFVAYLDESGDSRDTDFFALAACVADWRVWREFNARWRRMLSQYAVPYLHMRESATLGRDHGWTKAQTHAFTADLLATLDSLEITVVGSVMSVADFRSLDPEEQAEFVDPTFCCFQDCLQGIALNGYLDFVGCKTDLIYSLQDEFGGRLRQLYEYMVKHDPDGSLVLGVLSFQDMRDVPGLQLADLVAWELRRYYHNKATRSELAWRYPFRRIMEHQLAQGIGLCRHVTGWALQFQAKGVWAAAQKVIWDDPDTWWNLIMETVPAPLEFVARSVRTRSDAEVKAALAAVRRARSGKITLP
jgi:hypothetical protein